MLYTYMYIRTYIYFFKDRNMEQASNEILGHYDFVKGNMRQDSKLGKTHIEKSVFFCGWTTKDVGRVNPPDHYVKKHFFFSKIRPF